MKCFIDCHSHFFNIVDIPLYLTVKDKIPMGTIKRLFGGLVLGALVPKLLKEKEEIILFFERSIEKNLVRYSDEIKTAVDDIEDILIIPLVMDFDIPLEIHLRKAVGGEPTVKEQYRRLEEAINSVSTSLSAKFCPFIGFDLRKLLPGFGDKLNDFIAFWDSISQNYRNINDLTQGKPLGIKLYPPLGFNPHPDKLPQKYRDFYQWCCDRDIPVTAHCQKGSYEIGSTQQALFRNTHPRNWEKILRKYPKLRLNLAHMGGEDQFDNLFYGRFLEKDSWTYKIIRLLKDYENTYADISAFDYSDSRAKKDFIKALKHDAVKKFGDGYELKNKILWGSDIPMIIDSKSYRKNMSKNGKPEYQYLLENFKRSLKTLKTSDADEIINNFTCENPKKFLKLD